MPNSLALGPAYKTRSKKTCFCTNRGPLKQPENSCVTVPKNVRCDVESHKRVTRKSPNFSSLRSKEHRHENDSQITDSRSDDGHLFQRNTAAGSRMPRKKPQPFFRTRFFLPFSVISISLVPFAVVPFKLISIKLIPIKLIPKQLSFQPAVEVYSSPVYSSPVYVETSSPMIYSQPSSRPANNSVPIQVVTQSSPMQNPEPINVAQPQPMPLNPPVMMPQQMPVQQVPMQPVGQPACR